MERNHLKIMIIALAAIAAMPQLVEATNLGSAAKNDLVNVPYGGSSQRAEFTLLMWTQDSQKFPVSMSFSKLPQGWSGFFEPNQFNLPPSDNVETVIYAGGTVYAKAVKVVVTAPPFSEIGKYEIVVKALAGGSDGDLSAQQERTFRLYVVVGNSNFPANQNSEPQAFTSGENNFEQKTESNKPLELSKATKGSDTTHQGKTPDESGSGTNGGSTENNLFTGMFVSTGEVHFFWVGILSVIIVVCAIIVYKKWGNEERYY